MKFAPPNYLFQLELGNRRNLGIRVHNRKLGEFVKLGGVSGDLNFETDSQRIRVFKSFD